MAAERERKPDWIRVRLNNNESYKEVSALVRKGNLHTVCEEAKCPNIHECWGIHKTATFMILGDICTRHCRFCAVKTGLPNAPDLDEPRRVAASVAAMGLKHVVVTMVTRDDLPDGGAHIISQTVQAIRQRAPECSIEILVSDLMAEQESVRVVTASAPEINSHNLETVRRLTARIRSRADYDRSLRYLALVKKIAPHAVTKSSLMLGLGETYDEVCESLRDLRRVDVDIVNIGQYLQPSKMHAPVDRYWHPDAFAALKTEALSYGFAYCESGPLVRSSYHAGAQYDAFLKNLIAAKQIIGMTL